MMKNKKAVEKSGAKAAEKRGGILRRRKRKSWERVLLLAACRKRGCGWGPTSTTPVLSWKEVGFVGGAQNTIIKAKPFSLSSFSFSSSSSSSIIPQISARKLASALWEFQYYFSPVKIMYSGVNHHRVRHHLHRLNKDEEIDHHRHNHDHHHPTLAIDPHRAGSPDHLPASAGSLRRHIAASLMRHHQSSERNKHALQPLSPASYGSSLEMAPYNPAATPDSSIELRGKIGESSYSFKTSTELLKVLNRIWSLEEQHASNVSLVKALKTELDHARARIKELLRDQQSNRHEIDELMKQISEDNLARKSKEQERLDASLQSTRDELEDERKLRKRSESLHRKLARELFEIKVVFSTTVKDLEKERNSNELLEQLCDEFAKGIREYAVRQSHKSDIDWSSIADHHNLILQISESWIDERLQIKDSSTTQKSSVVDKLRHEIEAFLAARQTGQVPRDPKETRLRRRSLESIPEASSTPQNVVPEAEQEELALSGRRKGQSPPSVQMSDQQHTPRDQSDTTTMMKTGEGTPTEISMLQKSDVYDSIKEGTYQRKKGYNEEGHGSNSKTVDKLVSELLLSEGGSFPPEYEYNKEVNSTSSTNPALRRNASPVRQWMTSMTSPDPRLSGSSMKIQPVVKDNTLKSKLQEPKSKGQRSRLKILKGLS